MTTIGYGDITPKNNIEVFFATIVVFIASGVFAYTLNSIGTILGNLNDEEKLLRQKLRTLNTFLKINNVHSQLQERIRNYLTYCWEQEKLVKDDETNQIIDKLPSNLKKELLHEIRGQALRTCEVLTKNFSQETLNKLSEKLVEVTYFPEEKIFSQNDFDDCSVYIVQFGEVQLYDQYPTTVCNENQQIRRKINVLKVFIFYLFEKSGDYFGQLSFFTGFSRLYSAQALGFTKLYKLDRNRVLEILNQDKPEKVEKNLIHSIQEKFCSLKDDILFNKLYHSIKISCLSCNSNFHLFQQCPILNYIPDIEKIIKTQNFPNFQHRKPFTRNNSFQTMQSLYNLKVIQDGIKFLKEDSQQSLNELSDNDEYSGQSSQNKQMSISLDKERKSQSEENSNIANNNLKPLPNFQEEAKPLKHSSHYIQHQSTKNQQTIEILQTKVQVRADSQIDNQIEEIEQKPERGKKIRTLILIQKNGNQTGQNEVEEQFKNDQQQFYRATPELVPSTIKRQSYPSSNLQLENFFSLLQSSHQSIPPRSSSIHYKDYNNEDSMLPSFFQEKPTQFLNLIELDGIKQFNYYKKEFNYDNVFKIILKQKKYNKSTNLSSKYMFFQEQKQKAIELRRQAQQQR